MTDFEKIVGEFSQIETVMAVALAGSGTSGAKDEFSDTDVYIYSEKILEPALRQEILGKYTLEPSFDNRFWESGDEMTLKNDGFKLDIMYREKSWIEGQIENVWVKNYASIGYTTCFLHNVKTSEVLFERGGWFSGLQKQISGEYPEKLAKNIIEKNLPLLKAKKYAPYYEQIENALKRCDYVSVNHRLAAFLASYFDILFALNKTFHPGEKRLVNFAKNCKLLPKNFESDVNGVLSAPYAEKIIKLDSLIENLYEIL